MTDNRAREALLLEAVHDMAQRMCRDEFLNVFQNAVTAMLEEGEPVDEMITACERLCGRLGIAMGELTRITH